MSAFWLWRRGFARNIFAAKAEGNFLSWKLLRSAKFLGRSKAIRLHSPKFAAPFKYEMGILYCLGQLRVDLPYL